MFGIGATLAINIALARLLGPAEFGTFLLISTVISCGALVAMFGLNEAGLRFVSASLAQGDCNTARAYLTQVFRWIAWATLAATTITVGGLAVFQAATSRFDHFWTLAGLTAIGLAALAWQTVTAEMLRGWHDLRAASLFSGGQGGGPLANAIFLTAIAAAILLYGHISATAAIGLLAGSIVCTLPIAIAYLSRRSRATLEPLAPKRAGAVLTDFQRRETLGVAGSLLAIQLLSFATQQFDVWIGGAVLSEHDLGLYGVSKRMMLLAAMPVQMAMLTVVSSIPHLHALGRIKELQQLLRRSAAYAAVPAVVALGLLMLFPAPLVRLVFGGSYADAAPALWALAAGNLALVLCGNPIHLLSLTGFHRTSLLVNALATALVVVAGPVAAIRFGFVGLAAVSGASLALQNVLLWILARRQVGIWTHVGFGDRSLRHESAEGLGNSAITMNEG
jgi:O-antigen/teichoic acid export membrane protein